MITAQGIKKFQEVFKGSDKFYLADPEIEQADENRSVDVTRRLDPSSKRTSPRNKNNTDPIMTDGYYLKYLWI